MLPYFGCAWWGGGGVSLRGGGGFVGGGKGEGLTHETHQTAPSWLESGG